MVNFLRFIKLPPLIDLFFSMSMLLSPPLRSSLPSCPSRIKRLGGLTPIKTN
jgi:hypothetical protein